MNRIIACVVFTMTVTIAMTQSDAHEFLSEILTQQNPGSNVIFTPVASYHLTQEEIVGINQHGQHVDYYQDRSKGLKAVARQPSDSCEASGSKTCGQFDHFTRARNAAITTCYQLENQSPDSYPSNLVPLYLAPSSFVDVSTASDNHHLNYNLIEGITFNCGYIIAIASNDATS